MDATTRQRLQQQQQRSRALAQSTASLDEYFSSKDAASEDSDAAAELVFARKQQLKTTTTTSNASTTTSRSAHLQTRSTAQLSHAATNTGAINKLHVVEKQVNADEMNGTSPSKVLRQFAAVDKENMEMGIEINIMTDKNVEVEVQVEEQDITDGECSSSQPMARLRDTNRNRLQRLGALYANADALSSPIHRTEAQFYAADMDGNDDVPRKPTKPRYDKLAALANTINQWEDDVGHTHVHTPRKQEQQKENKQQEKQMQKTVTAASTAAAVVPPPKPDLPSRHLLGKQSAATATAAAPKTTKPLQWDRKVMDSLEAQGFQRRPDAHTVKYAYEYEQQQQRQEQEQKQTSAAAEPNKKPPVAVKSGLVSGRAAMFEHKTAVNQQQQQTQQQQQQTMQKDPTELSLKERMQLFERNKGEALVPKAALGMPLPANKIQQPQSPKHNKGTSHAAVKTGMQCKLQDKLAALAAHQTMSEQKIRQDLQKQRQQDMQVLANRFTKPKHLCADSETDGSTQPPTPPPMPPTVPAHKRRSAGTCKDEENKRARIHNTATVKPQATRLYPHLSDLDSAASYSDNEQAATTASLSTNEQPQQQRQHQQQTQQQQQDEDNDSSSYMDSSENDDSLRRQVMQTVRSKQRQASFGHEPEPVKKLAKEVHYASRDYYFGSGAESSLNSSNASAGIDDYLDEALDEQEDDGDDDFTQDSDAEDNLNSSKVSKESKMTTTSNSFSFRKSSKGVSNNFQTIAEDGEVSTTTTTTNGGNYMQPITSELSVNQNDDNMVQLVHTVSFYRRQQTANSASSTPIRKVRREQQMTRAELDANCKTQLHFESPAVSTSSNTTNNNTMTSEDESDLETDDGFLVQQKIQQLLDEVCKQQQVIAQTSQALNLCAATVEFSGSTESVEGERHLLVATHRRQACLDEVQRLRVERTLRPLGAPKEKGRLTVKDIMLPLRQDYIRKLAADTISGHHLVCLLKYNENVLATKTVPTLPGLLAVKFPDVLTLNNVYADFKITLEIYGMTAQREVLPHEVKYHINLHKKSGLKTPKKKGSDNLLVMPPVQSPAGPHVVRTPALVQYGYAIFSLREIQRKSWSLTQVLGVCPLEGIVHMKVNCELSVSVEHKGFLTMYEDISGFGAWHRRWCYLNGAVLSYWKYPDDEKIKTPMGSIDLYACITQKVSTAPRDICARLHTMLLECERPAKDSDEETLTLVPNGRTTIVRHLLSADTKEEREIWCAYFNKTLTLLRAWGTTTTTQ